MKNEITAAFKSLESEYRRAAPRALYKKANKMMTEMKKRTPVETGTLRDSGQVDKPAWAGSALTVLIGFGGAAEEYAIYVHENLNAHHEHGQAKFMESVLVEENDNIFDEVSADIAEAMGL